MKDPARPLRFVALALCAWIGGRAVLLSQPEGDEPSPPPAPPRTAPIGDFAPESTPLAAMPSRATNAAAAWAEKSTRSGHTPRLWQPASRVIGAQTGRLAEAEALDAGVHAPALTAMLAAGASALRPAPQPGAGAASHPGPKRLSGYGWMFVRDSGSATGLANNGQLGGSQAGMRLDYALGPDPARGFQIGARFSAPLEGKGREAAIGLGWKPGPDIPLTLSIERRIGLDSAGRDAFAASVAGGVNAIALPLDFKLDAYAQAGIVGAKKRDQFVDGSLSATRTIVTGNTISVAAGMGAWGAAQPGVERLDIGPRVRIRLETGHASIGVALDWRQRVAGDAAPASGPALTIDGSF
ncbi:hypothetical protein [Sphingobium boeckii]|uniref:Autotransporter outer membrane beta-barrel domain-containing protein n=1 Tax=Sphingobium boeckii TaxID=1082345 RepID=A0A7W9ALF5_9SPHN|nr:hypothetical protein [Sphingobium boeckii]MBB5687612.1 hypothetical protein [Sphingobium boeckii]